MLPVNRLHNTAAPALRITIPSSTARNGTISRPPGSTYMSLISGWRSTISPSPAAQSSRRRRCRCRGWRGRWSWQKLFVRRSISRREAAENDFHLRRPRSDRPPLSCGAHTSSDRLRGSLRSGDTGDRAPLLGQPLRGQPPAGGYLPDSSSATSASRQLCVR